MVPRFYRCFSILFACSLRQSMAGYFGPIEGSSLAGIFGIPSFAIFKSLAEAFAKAYISTTTHSFIPIQSIFPDCLAD